MKRILSLGPISIEHLTLDEALNRIEAFFDGCESRRVAFCNAHTASNALFDVAYRRALSHMLVFNDGVALDMASKLTTGAAFPSNLNGTDFIPRLLATSKRSLRIYLLGAKPEVVERAAAKLTATFPHHSVVGWRHGYFSSDEEAEIVAEVARHAPDVLLVGMGNPRQELFMDAYREALNSKVVFGVGALFDFLSGAVPRAPLWVRRVRLEWLYRMWLEPRRLAYRYTIGAFTFVLAMAVFRIQGAQRPHWLSKLREPGRVIYRYTVGALTFALAIVFFHLHNLIGSP